MVVMLTLGLTHPSGTCQQRLCGLGWLHVKFVLVVMLSGFHGWAVGYSKALGRGVARLSGRTLRLMNEIPGVTVSVVAILAIVQPF